MTDDQETREWAKALFADPDAPRAEEPESPAVDPAKGNVVPREGETPISTRSAADEFVAELFGGVVGQ